MVVCWKSVNYWLWGSCKSSVFSWLAFGSNKCHSNHQYSELFGFRSDALAENCSVVSTNRKRKLFSWTNWWSFYLVNCDDTVHITFFVEDHCHWKLWESASGEKAGFHWFCCERWLVILGNNLGWTLKNIRWFIFWKNKRSVSRHVFLCFGNFMSRSKNKSSVSRWFWFLACRVSCSRLNYLWNCDFRLWFLYRCLILMIN